ncbi:MAG: hypothetical protein ACJ8FY_19730 [Gemmataceae bacterium]
MEPSFTELEQQLLRFLKEEFLEKGSRPAHMLAPATMNRDVMERFSLELPQFREVMARLEYLKIVRVIGIEAPNGHLQIDPAIVEIVRKVDDQAEQAKHETPNRMDQAKRYFFSKWWFVVFAIVLIVLASVATVVANLKTIREWFGGRP